MLARIGIGGIAVVCLTACGSMAVYGVCDTGDDPCSVGDVSVTPGGGGGGGGGGGIGDVDGDGFVSVENGGDDCDDGDANIYPGADEQCDSVDNDCDDEVDEDEDGDGSGVCEDCDEANDSIYPGAIETCDDGVDSDCDGQDCLVYVENFESAGALGTEWAVGGVVAWNIQSVTTYEGSQAASSGAIGNDQSSSMTLTLNFSQASSLSFWYKVSSEPLYDDLEFYVDGNLQNAWNGEVPWQQYNTAVSAGQHTFDWRFVKDGSLSLGTDKAWVDLVEAVGATP